VLAPAGLRDTTQSRFGNRTPSRDPDCVSARDAATCSAPHRGAGLILQGAGGVEPRSSAAWHEPVGFALHHLMALAAQGFHLPAIGDRDPAPAVLDDAEFLELSGR